jgi:hypothetical protein
MEINMENSKGPGAASMTGRTATALARGFLTDAEEYLRAAQKLDQTNNGLASSPQYYLACHSIELILKAFILVSGGTEKELRKIGHDLQKACERATELGLRPNDKRTGQIVSILAPYHLDHGFRYRKTRFATFPVYEELCEVVDHLVMQIGPTVDAAMLAEIRAKGAHDSE